MRRARGVAAGTDAEIPAGVGERLGREANRLLAPLLAQPFLPVIPLPPIPFDPAAKLPAAISYAGDRPLAWLDDALTAEAHAWASTRAAPALLVDVDPARGLTRAMVDQGIRWADGLIPPV